jgi:hypothetical protein
MVDAPKKAQPMDNNAWLGSATVAVIVTVPVLTVAAYLVRDQLRARRNLQYKSLAEHAALNSADRETWMSGVLPNEGTATVDRFGGRILPAAQIVTVLVLAAIILLSEDAEMRRLDNEEKQIADLELQLHGLAFAPTWAGAAPALGGENGAAEPAPAGRSPVGTPLQQVCANLIGRVADAYEKAESSKIGQSLEELVNRLECQKHLQQ